MSITIYDLQSFIYEVADTNNFIYFANNSYVSDHLPFSHLQNNLSFLYILWSYLQYLHRFLKKTSHNYLSIFNEL